MTHIFAFLKFVMRRRSYFALTSATLALAVGANLVVFTIVGAIWLRPNPLPDPDRLVMVLGDNSNSGSGDTFGFAELGLKSHLRDSGAFSAVAGQVLTSGSTFSTLLPIISLDRVGHTSETLGITPEYFSVLSLTIRGRDFTKADDHYGAEPVAIISDRLWKKSFGGDPGIVGGMVPASPFALRIIGIAPPDFEGARLGEHADIWIPRNLVPRVAGLEASVPEGAAPLTAIARLRGGITPVEAERMVAAHDAATQRSSTHLYVVPLTSVFGSPDSRNIVLRDRSVFSMITAAGGLVLLAGCVTLMALVLVHYERRRHELAVRLALGASRMRLVAQLAAEMGWLIAAGSAGALLLASWGLHALPAVSLPGSIDLGRLDLSIDWRVAVTGLATTILTLLFAAFLPLLRFTHAGLARDLVSASTTGTASSHRIRRMLLGIHVAATAVVLVAAALFVQSVAYGFTRAAGFDVEHTVFINLRAGTPFVRSREEAQELAAARAVGAHRLIDRLASLPGVDWVALGSAPVGADPARQLLNPRSVKTESQSREVRLVFAAIGTNFLSALGVPMLAGRPLSEGDAGVNPTPAVLTASFARMLWPEGDAVGKEFSISSRKYVVVGLSADFACGSVMLPHAAALLTATKVDLAGQGFDLRLAIRTERPGAQIDPIRRAISDVRPEARQVDVATGREIIARDLGRERLGAWFFSGFGLVALILGIGGVFGLVAYVVESRRREFGVRLALGAEPHHLIRQAMETGLWPVAIGAAAGLGAAAVLLRVAAALLSGISRFGPLAYAAAGILMAASAAVAAYLAAWRVRRVSPADALRCE